MKKLIDNECRVCGRDRFTVWGEKAGQILYKCQNCGLVFFFPYPKLEELNAFYNDSYHKNRNYDGEGDAGLKRKLMYAQDIKDLETIIPSRGRILDVGCAEGLFLSFLDDSWEKHGIDCSEYAVRKANAKKGVRAYVKDLLEMPEQHYDVVHFRGVIEHLLDPLSAVKEASKRLKPGGFLVLSNTPNSSGIVPLLYRGRFRLVLPNEHLHYFEHKTIRIMGAKGGFRLHKFKFPYFGTPYCSFWQDLCSIPINLMIERESPPFWGNIFTAYLQLI